MFYFLCSILYFTNYTKSCIYFTFFINSLFYPTFYISLYRPQIIPSHVFIFPCKTHHFKRVQFYHKSKNLLPIHVYILWVETSYVPGSNILHIKYELTDNLNCLADEPRYLPIAESLPWTTKFIMHHTVSSYTSTCQNSKAIGFVWILI